MSAVVAVIAIISIIVLCTAGFLLFKQVSNSQQTKSARMYMKYLKYLKYLKHLKEMADVPVADVPVADVPDADVPVADVPDGNATALDVRGEWILTSARDAPGGEWVKNPGDLTDPNQYRLYFDSTANGTAKVVFSMDGQQEFGSIYQKGANLNEFEIASGEAVDSSTWRVFVSILFSPTPGSTNLPVGSTAVIGGDGGYMILTKRSNATAP